MKFSSPMKRVTVASALVAFLAGCAAGSSTLPLQSAASSSLSGAPVDTPAQHAARGSAADGRSALQIPAAHPDRSRSWMLPEAKTAGALLYVADEYRNEVYVYSYPKHKLEGTLTGFGMPSGVCSDKTGDVFIINGGGTSVEVYARGGTSPLHVLALPGYPGFGCSVDPKTGDLAVGGSQGTCTECGANVAIFSKSAIASGGVPTNYAVNTMWFANGCTYDNASNLFCVGKSDTGKISSNNKLQLMELANGSSQFTVIPITAPDVTGFGDIKWDGQHLALGSLGPSIYQIAVAGTGAQESASVVSTTQFQPSTGGWVWDFGFAPASNGSGKLRAILPSATDGDNAVGFWYYPAGGKPFEQIRKFSSSSYIDGVAVSQAP